ncbi:hypothetical protein PpBr36_00528 [Pyricularia pennisetigena]|uniref:hypothetical protein n=1 Tax=Pyricularia pennisetigena TaxID=1578925 RepID=UPI00114DAED9|nr:hypothetical protein PpBr36_00528 [Pyricularia pennisetigena]TLS29558.1 hypothetical protein PpBr36_00528 [Pyricularia pennisetigena]
MSASSALHHLMVWRAGGCTRSISSPRAATTAPMHWAVGLYCVILYCNYRRLRTSKTKPEYSKNILCR